MIRVVALLLLISVLDAGEVPPIERAFRFLVVGDNGKPVDGVPFHWNSEVEGGVDGFGRSKYTNVARKVLLSANGGIVEIPKHQFSHFQADLNAEELKKSADWMVDREIESQGISWDVYRIENPYGATDGPPTPGFDAVFKVLSKKGISNLIRYNARHNQVPCDGTPTPLRVLGGPSAQVKNPDEADVVITIKRPDQEIFSKESGLLGIAKPLRVPWVLESKTLRFAHFAPDTDLSADYHHRTWVQRLEVEPTNPDRAKSEGDHRLRLWAMIPGEKPLVVPLTCSIGLSFDSKTLGKAVYMANFEVLIPLAPCTRFHPDLLSLAHYKSLAPEISGEAINRQLDPIRAAALTHAFPADLTTAPLLRYDSNPPIPPGKKWTAGMPPVLLPPDTP